MKVNWDSALKVMWEYVKIIVFSFIFVFVLTTFIVRPVKVNGPSMYPTLVSGQLGFTNILSLNLTGIDRFDVVVADRNNGESQIVKRVIGLPNEEVEYKNGKLYINGVYTEESFFDQDYVLFEMQYEADNLFTKDFGPVVLGADEYFLVGDNRLHSSDSRMFGAFKLSDITSKSVYVWFPFDQMRIVN